MADIWEIAGRSALMGLAATAILDLWILVQKQLFGVPIPDWGLVGRWVGHFPQGRLVHESIAKAAPIPGERVLGWTVHYAVGLTFATIAVLLWGLDWARRPTFLPALVVGMASVVAPYFVMQPGMGLGIAASKAPKPWPARRRSFITHTVFGVALYLAAIIVAALWRA
ncbi:MAG TPA: DUF2938 domain-containing protein [Caulobacterales bacterium]|nr:DUF2938 domain-containing protein [Caulobacterales bacterium]